MLTPKIKRPVEGVWVVVVTRSVVKTDVVFTNICCEHLQVKRPLKHIIDITVNHMKTRQCVIHSACCGFFSCRFMEDVKLSSRRSFSVARNTHAAKKNKNWVNWPRPPPNVVCVIRSPTHPSVHLPTCTCCPCVLNNTISWTLSKKCFVLGFRCCQVAPAPL